VALAAGDTDALPFANTKPGAPSPLIVPPMVYEFVVQAMVTPETLLLPTVPDALPATHVCAGAVGCAAIVTE